MNDVSLSRPIPNIQLASKGMINQKSQEDKKIIICVHYMNFDSHDNFLSLTSKLSSIFGTKSSINQISDTIFVVESKCEDIIPSFKTIDECCQNVQKLPSIINMIDDETTNIENQNEATINEIYKLKRLKTVLIKENQEMEKELNKVKTELQKSKKKSHAIRSNCLKLIDSLFPPSAID